MAIVIKRQFVIKGFDLVFLQCSLTIFQITNTVFFTFIFDRTLHDLSYYRRIRIFKNWCQGRYEEHIFFHHKHFNPSQIFLEKESLYITHGGQLRVHRRLKKRIIKRKPERLIGRVLEADITYFTKKENTIFAGRRNGRVLIVSTDTDSYVDEQIDTTASNRIDFLDFDKDLFVTTTRNSTNLWRKLYELDIPYLDPVATWNSGNKCLRLSPDANYCALGKYNEKARTALRIIDLST